MRKWKQVTVPLLTPAQVEKYNWNQNRMGKHFVKWKKGIFIIIIIIIIIINYYYFAFYPFLSHSGVT